MQLDQSRVTFTKALDNLIVIASLQTAFVALDEASTLLPAPAGAAMHVPR